MSIPFAYAHFKDMLEALLGLTRDALHVHFGILLYVLFALTLRGPRRFVRALLLLTLLALLNEASDIAYSVSRERAIDWVDSIADVLNTLVWPLVWCLFGERIVRALGGSERAGAASPEANRPGLPVQVGTAGASAPPPMVVAGRQGRSSWRR